MTDKAESQPTAYPMLGEGANRVAPRTVWENRNISARLRSEQTVRPDSGRYCRQAVVDLGTVPAAFDPGELAERAPASPKAAHVEVRLAVNAWEHLQAFNLVHEQYVAFGYMEANENRVRVTPWNLRSLSHTFIALRYGRIVGTLTCIEDSPLGLPADELYPQEILALRAKRGKLLEVSALAISSQETDTTVVMELIRHLITLSRSELHGTDWVITINPRHVRFYQKVMLFETLGEEKASLKVNGAPAVLLRMDLMEMPAKYAVRYGRREGARNLHHYFFSPKEEQSRLAELRNDTELRIMQWGHICRVLELIGGLKTRPTHN